MTNKEYVLDTLRQFGKQQATNLRADAVAGTVTDTEIIDSEPFIPDFDPDKDYTDASVGTPVRDDDQVYGLLQPHNPSDYSEEHPADFPALWGLKHTTNPEKAKPYVAPSGTSGLYNTGEYMVWTDGSTYGSTIDNNSWTPETYAAGWAVYTG